MNHSAGSVLWPPGSSDAPGERGPSGMGDCTENLMGYICNEKPAELNILQVVGATNFDVCGLIWVPSFPAACGQEGLQTRDKHECWSYI